MLDRIKMMRVKHYIKNLLILVPAFFGKVLLQWDSVKAYCIAIIIFSFASSIVYIINDIIDYENDRVHPIKKNRPIASRKVTKKEAVVWCIFLFLVLMALCINFELKSSILWIEIYILVNVFYSIIGKNIPIMDVMILASGFVIRIIYGASIEKIEISSWLYLTVFAVSLYMGMGKRQKEIILQKDNSTRKVLKFYTEEYLGNMMHMCMTLAVIFYALWSANFANSTGVSRLMIWSLPIILAIVMRYEMQVGSESAMGDPVNVLFGDNILLVLTFLYAVFSTIVIYFT